MSAEELHMDELRAFKPQISREARPYWEGIQQGKLLYQQCQNCGMAVWRPRSICPYCDSMELRWRQSAGLGEVYSFSTIYRPPGEAFRGKVPYTLGIIRMDEDYYMFSEISVGAPEEVVIGMRVRVEFEPFVDNVVLPKFEQA